jgi:membrane glycosyltransferase
MSDENEPGHGHSPAAWVAVVVMLIGITAGTFAFWFDQALIVWISAGVVVFGLLLGLVLAKLGYGVKGPRYVPKNHS